MKVTEKDLVGEIKDFPIEIVQKMCEQQTLQKNLFDPTVFQEQSQFDKKRGGFNWDDTIDGDDFWKRVIYNKEFDLFFKIYPIYPKVMEVSGCSDFSYSFNRVVFMEKKNTFMAWSGATTLEEAEDSLDASSWEYARDIKPAKEMTLKEVIDELGYEIKIVEQKKELL